MLLMPRDSVIALKAAHTSGTVRQMPGRRIDLVRPGKVNAKVLAQTKRNDAPYQRQLNGWAFPSSMFSSASPSAWPCAPRTPEFHASKSFCAARHAALTWRTHQLIRQESQGRPGSEKGARRTHILRHVSDITKHLPEPGATRAFPPVHCEEVQQGGRSRPSNLTEEHRRR